MYRSMCFILLAAYPGCAYMKAICIIETHVLKSFSPKEFYRGIFAFEHKLGTSMPKSSFEIWGILKN